MPSFEVVNPDDDNHNRQPANEVRNVVVDFTEGAFIGSIIAAPEVAAIQEFKIPILMGASAITGVANVWRKRRHQHDSQNPSSD